MHRCLETARTILDNISIASRSARCIPIRLLVTMFKNSNNLLTKNPLEPPERNSHRSVDKLDRNLKFKVLYIDVDCRYGSTTEKKWKCCARPVHDFHLFVIYL